MFQSLVWHATFWSSEGRGVYHDTLGQLLLSFGALASSVVMLWLLVLVVNLEDAGKSAHASAMRES